MGFNWQKYDQGKAEEIAKRHGAAAITEAHANIQKMGLVDRGEFIKSLRATPKKQDMMVNRIQFDYIFYGRFHETGAKNIFGRGETLERNPWRSMAFDKIMPELQKEFADFYGDLVLEELPAIDSLKMSM